MPRKKQTVQKQRRQKSYTGGMSGDATKVERKGVFRIFSNYRLFALIGAGAIVAGVILGAVLTTTGGTTTADGDVRGDDVIRTTPEPGSTATAPEEVKQYAAPPPLTIDAAKTYTATIKTDKGDVKVELLDEQAPQAVNNFVFLARDGYYDGVEFFRVVQDFVAQTGDPTGTGIGGPGYDIPFESTDTDAEAGIVAMAKPEAAGAPNNGSQFFFLLSDQPSRDGTYTVFGRVVEGMDVLEQLLPRDPRQPDAPAADSIESITIEEA
jgi:cyclophilin family peptidyl-prolyl cis-trans isomerase